MKKMKEMGEQIEMCENWIEVLKEGSYSSQTTKSLDPTTRLEKSLTYLNLKGVAIEKLKKTISTQNEQSKDKDNNSESKAREILQYARCTFLHCSFMFVI